MNIYLDIDGVLLTDSLSNPGRPSEYSLELLRALTSKYKVFWLTTHCRGGENHAPERLYPKFPPETKEYIDKIIPTDWGTWKTDAIDFTQDFRWLDDDVYPEELDVLANNNASDKLIHIDLQKNPGQLKEVIQLLK